MTSSSSLDAFRERVRTWFGVNTPTDWTERMGALDEHGQMRMQRDWLALLATEGFQAPHVPTEFGGGGYDVASRAILFEEWARSGAPPLALFSVSLYHMPSTLLQAGTEEQQRRYIPGALAGEIWCQGFSEPDAGSDLASLRTRAVRTEDDSGYLVTGRKIWTSHAADASYCLLLARTSVEERRQAGITYMIVDMSDPGVSVRQILQSTRQEEFCEVTFDDVFVPASDVIGAEGDGWNVAQRTLSTERGPLALEIVERIDVGRRNLRDLIGSDAGRAEEWSGELVDMIARSQALRCMAGDLINQMAETGQVGGLSSILKVASADFLRAVVGTGSIAAGEDSFMSPKPLLGTSWFSPHWMTDYINSWGWSIGAGSSEIQRNIIAERLLGMPKG